MAWTDRLASGQYRGRYRDPAGKIRTAPGGPWSHKSAALRAAGAEETKSRAPGWKAPEAARRPWGEWCEDWWPTRNVEGSTLASDVGRRDRHVTPRWGDVPLCDITRQDIRAWAAELRQHGTPGPGEQPKALAPATVDRIVHLLSASLMAAVDAEILGSNPAARLGLGGASPIVERFLTREEYGSARTALAELDADPIYPAFADLLVGTGARWGEAVALHRERLPIARRMLDVVEAFDQKSLVVKPYPKGKRRRVVPIPEWVQLPGAETDRTCTHEHTQGRCRSALVYVNRAGGTIDSSHFTKAWQRACVNAGLGHVRIHDLRHTYASWLLQAGIPLAEVGKLLGHVSPLTTQRYAHLAETPSAAVLAALSDPRGRAKSTRVPRGKAGLRIVP